MEDRNVQMAHGLGQSLWLDNLSRRLIDSGKLTHLRDLGVTGITSNPTIFQKAISDSDVYEESIKRLMRKGLTPSQIIWELMIEDVQAAADILRPVYEATDGGDGFVSIEVSPEVAHDTEKTVAMVRDLRDRAARPNVMVKIPATREGVPAIRRMIAEGANINVTLIFSVSRYEEVVEAFFSGLEELAANHGSINRIRSVASFFVSRVDVKADELIDSQLSGASPEDQERIRGLRGKIGIANSKIAYQSFKKLHSGSRWERLAAMGAHPQQCLWASTSVKDPHYPDTMYVDALIGPETVDTLPEKALEAFMDHGVVRRMLDEDLDVARKQLAELSRFGIDLAKINAELESEGVEIFSKSYEGLLQTITEEVQKLSSAD